MEKKDLPTEIEVDRIVLRKHDPAVAPLMFEAVNGDRARLGRFMPWVAKTQTLADSEKYIQECEKAWSEGTLYDFGIYLRQTKKYIGNIGVHHIDWASDKCELGYWIEEAFEGHGYMTEAAAAMEEILFAHGFNRIEIRCDPTNARSTKIPDRLGFILEGRLRENFRVNGKLVDSRVYAKLKSDCV